MFPSFPFVRTSIYFLIPVYQDYLNSLFPAKVSVITFCPALPCQIILPGIPFHCFILLPRSYQASLSFRDQKLAFLTIRSGFLTMGPDFLSEFLSPFCSVFILNSFPVLTLALLLSLDTHQIQMKPQTMPWGVNMVNTWLKTQLKKFTLSLRFAVTNFALHWLSLILNFLQTFPIDLQQYCISHLISFKQFLLISSGLFIVNSARPLNYFRLRIISFTSFTVSYRFNDVLGVQ